MKDLGEEHTGREPINAAGLPSNSNSLLADALTFTGYVICEFPPDVDPCEKCGCNEQQLYFRSVDVFSQDGEYSCADCVIEEYKSNLEWGESLIGIAR